MKRGLKIVAALVLLFLVYSAYPFLGSLLVPFSPPPDLGDAARFTSVEVEMIDWATESHPTQSTIVTSQDASAIAKLVDVLESGERIDDCRCLRCGFIRFPDGAGAPVEMQLVPGHGEATYDIRYHGRRYSIDRSALRDALLSVGADLPEYSKPDKQGA